MNRPFHRLLLAVALVAAACSTSSPGEKPPMQPPPQSPSEAIPDTPPHIQGVVTAVSGTGGIPQIRVEENPAETSGSAKASVRLTDATRVWRRTADGVQRAAAGDVAVGQRVSAWFTGPVTSSYPAMATASAFVIEAGAR